MAVPTIRGRAGAVWGPDGSLHLRPDRGAGPPYVVGDNPPKQGDLIIMGCPPGTAPPAGWTHLPQHGACWRYAEGTELSFPAPAVWVSGYRPPTDEGSAV